MTNNTVQIGSLEVSRLIVGGNPFSGISHQSPQRDLEMMRYYTSARVQETLREAENVGVNTFLGRADRYIMRLLLEYRQAGGGIQWFAQTCSEYGAIDRSVQHARMADAQACYIHGGVMDRLLAQNQLAEVPALITEIRNAGLVVGIAGHNPAVFEWAEEHIDVDFYMCSYYNPSRRDEHAEHRSEAIECFADEDRQLMVRVIAQLGKPAIHYKIMAAGRNNPEDAFAFVAQHLRPKDAVCVGVFTQENSSMLADDLELVQQSLRTAGVCEQSGRQ
ncbi:MAG: hypothetical protein MUQ10_11815 [Anaerolineae bacterium]|nr:hypothetical protein [Anaerolineae bacterium]